MFKKITMITGLLALSSAMLFALPQNQATSTAVKHDQTTAVSEVPESPLMQALRQIVVNNETLPVMLKLDASGADKLRKAIVDKLILNKIDAITKSVEVLKRNGDLRPSANDHDIEKPGANLTEAMNAVMRNDLDVAFLLTVSNEDKATQRAIDVLILNKLTDIENKLAHHESNDRLDATCFFLELFEHPDVLKFDKKASTEDLLKHYSPEQLVKHSKAVFSVYEACLRAPVSVSNKQLEDSHK